MSYTKIYLILSPHFLFTFIYTKQSFHIPFSFYSLSILLLSFLILSFLLTSKTKPKVYHLPVSLTAFQFAIGTLLVAFMWGLNLYKRPKLTSSQVLILTLVVLLLFYLFSFVILRIRANHFWSFLTCQTLQREEDLICVSLSCSFLSPLLKGFASLY